MAIDYCNKHDAKFDRDWHTECPRCARDIDVIVTQCDERSANWRAWFESEPGRVWTGPTEAAAIDAILEGA